MTPPVYYPPSVTTIAASGVAKVFPAFADGCYLVITSQGAGFVSLYGAATAAYFPLPVYVKFEIDYGSAQGLTVYNPNNTVMTIAGARF